MFRFDDGGSGRSKPVSLGPRGESFARLAITAAACKGWVSGSAAVAFAETRWGAGAPATQAVKAAVTGGATEGTWGEQLSGAAAAAAAEFFNLVMPITIIGKMALRKVPFHVKAASLVSGASIGWRGEGRARKVGRLTFDATALDPLEVSASVVLSNELVRNSEPSAEAAVSQHLVDAVRSGLDAAIIDPDIAEVAGVNPASITNGIVPGAAALATIKSDIAELVGSFKGDLVTSVFVAHPRLAMYLSGADHPAVTARGGMLAGLPLITSSSVPQVGTGNELLVLADGGGIAIAQDPTFNMQTVSEAAVEMDDAPIGSSVDPMPTTLVSLFQVDASALAIDHRCNWKIIRAGSVATLSVATS